MVRAHMKQTPDEKKEAHKKKTPAKKKIETGSWPCRMNGCNKVFAREADLKRHQRTTKTHSMPGFACPQCDATFTRTDALRRHQKSRHNGIVIAPVEPEKAKSIMDNDGESSGSRSRSVTPSKEGEGSSANSSPPQAVAQPGTSGPGSYYRQHTLNQSYVPPRSHSGMVMDPHYSQSIGPPTSAARLHQATWSAPPPWAEAAPPPGHPIYHMPPPPPGYYPAPYRYGPPPGMPLPPHMHPGMPPEYMSHPPYGAPYPPPVPLPRNGSASPPQREKDDVESEDADMEDGSSRGSPAIDPSLEQPAPALHPSSTQANQQDPPSTERDDAANDNITHAQAAAAVKAVLTSQKAGEPAAAAPDADTEKQALPAATSTAQPTTVPTVPEQASEHPPSSVSAQDASADLDMDADADGEADGDGEEVKGDDDDVPASIASPQDGLVTEDGVAMLNPAELLTQQSLVSPSL